MIIAIQYYVLFSTIFEVIKLYYYIILLFHYYSFSETIQISLKIELKIYFNIYYENFKLRNVSGGNTIPYHAGCMIPLVPLNENLFKIILFFTPKLYTKTAHLSLFPSAAIAKIELFRVYACTIMFYIFKIIRL